MKQVIKQFLPIFLLTLSMLSCQRQKENADVKATNPSSKLNKTAGTCTCEKRQGCEDECTKQFMDNLDMKRFLVTWESCDNNDLDGGCRGAQAAQDPSTNMPYTSEVLFCYPDWGTNPGPGCYLQMQINNLPPCIKCITDFPRCILFKVNCVDADNGDGTTTYTMGLVAEDPDVTGSTSADGYEWTLTTVTGDPKIKICCEKKIGNWNTWFCCTGDIQSL